MTDSTCILYGTSCLTAGPSMGRPECSGARVREQGRTGMRAVLQSQREGEWGAPTLLFPTGKTDNAPTISHWKNASRPKGRFSGYKVPVWGIWRRGAAEGPEGPRWQDGPGWLFLREAEQLRAARTDSVVNMGLRFQQIRAARTESMWELSKLWQIRTVWADLVVQF